MKCAKCKGSKEYQGLGWVKIECPVCLGVGYVKDEAKQEAKQEAKKVDEPNSIKAGEYKSTVKGRKSDAKRRELYKKKDKK